MAIKPALIVALLGFCVGEYVAPVSEQVAVSQRALAYRNDPNLAGRYGAWNRDGGTFIHVDAVQRGGLIFGVTLISFDENGFLVRTVAANRGTYQGEGWLLEDVAVTSVTDDGTRVSSVTTMNWASEITPSLLTLDSVKPESLPATQLWGYAQYLRNQGLVANDIELAFWNKILQPLSCAGLVVLAMSFIFGPLREGNMSARIFAGVLAGVIFRISQDFFGPVTLLMGLSGGVAALLTVLLCWSAGLVLLLRRQ
jgi:lipopolysaccharide export system permease protein